MEIVMYRSTQRIAGSRSIAAPSCAEAPPGVGLAAARYCPSLWTPGASAATNLSVLSPLAPDPSKRRLVQG